MVELDTGVVGSTWDGRPRMLFKHTCEQCKEAFRAPRHAHSRYCSRKCCGAARRTRAQRICAFCGGAFESAPSKARKSRSGLLFCSRRCKDRAQRIEGLPALHLPHYGTGACAYRRKALRDYGARCQRCGYSTDKRMLDVHHVNRDRSKNDARSLAVLCVWCHSLETRHVSPHDWSGRLGPITQRECASPAS